MVRKVTLNRSEVELAKHFNVPLEEVAKRKLPKRGRPAGAKNKKTIEKEIKEFLNPVDSFSQTLKTWDEMENDIDWEEIAKKQESKLAAYIQENDALANICIERWQEIQHLKYLIGYLETRNANSSI